MIKDEEKKKQQLKQNLKKMEEKKRETNSTKANTKIKLQWHHTQKSHKNCVVKSSCLDTQ